MTWQVWEGDPLGVVNLVYICQLEQMLFAQHKLRPGKWDAQTSLGFCDTTG